MVKKSQNLRDVIQRFSLTKCSPSEVVIDVIGLMMRFCANILETSEIVVTFPLENLPLKMGKNLRVKAVKKV